MDREEALKKAQLIADQIREKVEGRTGLLAQFVVERFSVERLGGGTYYSLKVKVGSGRYVHVETFQASPNDAPIMTGLERDRSASDSITNIVSVSDH